MDTSVADGKRHDMWCYILGYEYVIGNKNKKKHLKEAWTSERGIMPHQVNEINCWDCGANIALNEAPYSLDCYATSSSNPKAIRSTDMYHVNAVAVSGAYSAPLEETQRGGLAASAEHARTEKIEKLREQFGLSDMKPPLNATELIARIKAGEFTFDDEYNPEQAYNWGYGYTWGIKWRKPDTKFDFEGFTAVEKLVKADYEHLKQDILILPLQDALKSVRDFEAKTYA